MSALRRATRSCARLRLLAWPSAGGGVTIEGLRGRPCASSTEPRRTPVTSNARFINPASMHKPPGYTHVVETTGPGRTVYIAGQLGVAADGKLAGGAGDFRAQASQAFENLEAALAAVDG